MRKGISTGRGENELNKNRGKNKKKICKWRDWNVDKIYIKDENLEKGKKV